MEEISYLYSTNDIFTLEHLKNVELLLDKNTQNAKRFSFPKQPVKGQLISERQFDVLNFPKKQLNLIYFCPRI